jgi:hypothetical protein
VSTTILVPFWGDHPAYRKWLTEWVRCYRASGCEARALVVTDEFLPAPTDLPTLVVDATPWQDLVDPRYPYDRKGGIVCAALVHLAGEALFIVDADAFLQRDPLPLLAPYRRELFAMPEDEGAFGKPYAEPDGEVVRRSGGILWVGATSAEARMELVGAYRQHFQALAARMQAGTFREERRLLEQHAWTFVADRRSAPILPRALNWPVCFRAAGANPAAAIHHHIGRRKWHGEPPPPEGILNERQRELLAGGRKGVAA